MLSIGFGGQFYTLWDVMTINHNDGVYQWQEVRYAYIQNISTSLDTVKEKYPDLGVDMELKGHHSFNVEKNRERIKLADDVYQYGKYRGSKFSDVDDENYLHWYYTNNDDNQYVIDTLVSKYGYIQYNDKLMKEDEYNEAKEYNDKFNSVISKIENNEPFEILNTSNIRLGYDSIDSSDTELCNVCLVFKDFKTCEYNGFEYGMPLIKGKAKRIKNNILNVIPEKYEKKDDVYYVYVNDFSIVKK